MVRSNGFDVTKQTVKIRLRKLILIALLSLNIYSIGFCSKCIPRKFDWNSVVCVCNSTYCDTFGNLAPPSERNTYSMYTSTLRGDRFRKTKGKFKFSLSSKGKYEYRVPDRRDTYQKIIGFGGAFTDSVGINLLSLSGKTRRKLLEAYFASSGLGYTLGRVPIGGTDFSSRAYTYDDRDNNDPDEELKFFKLQDEDYEYKIRFIKDAEIVAKKKLRLLASCWSGPAWMKTNGELEGQGFLKEEYYDALADYHVRFLKEYNEQAKIKFEFITTGNEPQNALAPGNPLIGIGWIPLNQSRWVGEHLGPRMKSSFPNTDILCGDDQRTVLPWWANEVIRNYGAEPYVKGTAIHWYFNDMAPATVLNQLHKNFPNKYILATESSIVQFSPGAPGVALGHWDRGEKYAFYILQDLLYWSVGWIDWNLALNIQGGPTYIGNSIDAAIIVNKTSDEFYKQPIYYALAHFSKFIPPGSHRIGIPPDNQNTTELSILSVRRPDKSVAVIILNRNDYDIPCSLHVPGKGYASLKIKQRSMNSMVFKD